METKLCLICKSPSEITILPNDLYGFNCIRCGVFQITVAANSKLSHYINTDVQVANLSGWLREHQNQTIDLNDLPKLSSLETPTVSEKADKLLRFISRKIPIAGDQLGFSLDRLRYILKRIEEKGNLGAFMHDAKNMSEFLSASWSRNADELKFILNDYLNEHQHFISDSYPLKITPAGWAHLDKLTQQNPQSKIVFIAMKFDDELKEFSEKWVEAAILSAGYKPIRIDKYQHNNLIDDEIIANIRRSKFIVADFTGNSFGVYYEVGFARGLNIPVICLCRKDYFDDEENKVHFDTNHYPFILWESERGEELKKQLQYRIEATFGKGKTN